MDTRYWFQLNDEDSRRLREMLAEIERLRADETSNSKQLEDLIFCANTLWRATVAEACVWDGFPSGRAPILIFGEQKSNVEISEDGIASWASSFVCGRGCLPWGVQEIIRRGSGPQG